MAVVIPTHDDEFRPCQGAKFAVNVQVPTHGVDRPMGKAQCLCRAAIDLRVIDRQGHGLCVVVTVQRCPETLPEQRRGLCRRQLADIVSVDVGAFCDGFHGDNAYTFIVGDTSEENKKLLRETEAALYKGIEQAVVGHRVGDISHAIEQHVSQFGYGIVRQFVGHGVGREMHEDPEVPNFGRPGHGPRLVEGMTLAIEPMINLKGDGVKVMPDGWTTKTVSGSVAAHFEHSIAITADGPVILTKRK